MNYRIYDKKWDRFYEQEECISLHWGKWELQRLFENGDKAECVEVDEKEVFLMLGSGVMDINDKEVFTGDEIKVGYGLGEVIFHAGCFMIQWIDDKEAI